jgi:hypothetical protein
MVLGAEAPGHPTAAHQEEGGQAPPLLLPLQQPLLHWRWVVEQLAPPLAVLGVVVCAGLATSRASFSAEVNRREPLPDVFIDNVPQEWLFDATLPGSWTHCAPDTCQMVVTALTAVCISAPSGFRGVRLVRAVRELSILHSLVLGLRATLVATTTLPSPVPACQRLARRAVAPDATAAEIEAGAAPPVCGCSVFFCNDLIFSGHTTTNMNSLWLVLLSPAPAWLKTTLGAAVALAALVTLLSRDHYTVDVLLACYIATGVCLLRREQIERAFR